MQELKLMKTQKDIIAFINENDITEYCDLVYYCLDNGLSEWSNVICNKSVEFFSEYLASCKRKSMHRAEK